MKNMYNRAYREADDSFFDDSYGVSGIHSNEFWIKCEEYDKFDQSEMTFQGRLYQKNPKTKKWQAYHFELYSDRLIRISAGNGNSNNSQSGANVNNNQNGQIQNQANLENVNKEELPEYLPLNACYLKKIKYSDTSYANYKYGIRLQKGELKSELFTESAENFNKLYEEIKRFCILPKFAKKYKVLTKFKSPSQMPNAHLYKCFRYSDSTQYCVRIIDKYTLTDQGRISVLKETAILRKIDHPSLIKLYEVYEDETNIFLIYELLQGKDLKSKLNELLCMDEKSVSDFIWKLLHGLHHMHSRNIVHRDIRLDNIFFRAPNNYSDVCISNFFLADFADQNRCVGQSYCYIPTKQNYKKYGTAGYLAPEVLKNKQYDCKVDIFSLGIIFYFFVFGRMPFEGKDAEEMLKLNEKCEIDFTQQPFFGKFTSSAFDLMKKMLEKDPKMRGDAATLLNHTWFVNMRNKGDDGKSRNGNNYCGFPTLSTVQEFTEGPELLSGCSQDSRILKDYDLKELRFPNYSEEFSNIKNDEDIPGSNYIYNVIKDGSLIYEDEFMRETVHDKMITLNKLQFMKVPSKYRHDSFHYHLQSRLGINIQEFYNMPQQTLQNVNSSNSTSNTNQVGQNLTSQTQTQNDIAQLQTTANSVITAVGSTPLSTNTPGPASGSSIIKQTNANNKENNEAEDLIKHNKQSSPLVKGSVQNQQLPLSKNNEQLAL
ncbi:hypothetical protein ABPG72_012339 [Tetrahymena utriculariae]